MKKFFILFSIIFCVHDFIAAQNVGIGIPVPIEKLQVDGNIKIGNSPWFSSTNSRFLKFGDADYITIGEEEADDKLTIRAKELFIRPSASYLSVPISIQGSTNYSHFYFGINEDTYIRGGKNNANVIINDISDGKVGIGMSNPARAMLEQNGAVGATSAIFGGDGTGISLQKNWPAIGFNSYLDGAGHKSINAGYGAQLGLNQTNGSLYLVSFPLNASANQLFSGFTQRFYISQLGRIGIGTDNPISDITIIQREITDLNEDADVGLTFDGNINNGAGAINDKWNIHMGRYSDGTFSGLGGLVFWNRHINGPFWLPKGAIGLDGAYYNISDSNTKKEITYMGNGFLSKIVLLKPATYHYKFDGPDNSMLNFGFIAQSVEKIFPECVATFSGTKMIAYSKFIPILTKGMQEQQQQIETLKKENADLKTRLEKLEQLVIKK